MDRRALNINRQGGHIFCLRRCRWGFGILRSGLLCILILLVQCSYHVYPAPRETGEEWGLAAEYDNVTLLSAIGGSSEYPVWSSDGTQIAFQYTDARSHPADDSAPRDIYVMNSNGTGERRLTHGAGNEFSCEHPSWAPDNRHLVCSCDVDGDYDLYTVDITTGDLTRLTNYPGHEKHPSWSPDGIRIAFSSNMDEPTNMDKWDIYIVNSDGADLKALTTGYWNAMPAWSPDSQRIAFSFSTERFSPLQLCTISSDGSEMVCNDDAPCDVVTWSPDGSQMACTSKRDGIIVVQTDTAKITTLLHTGSYHLSGISWSPDGTQLVLTAGGAQIPLVANDLYVLDANP